MPKRPRDSNQFGKLIVDLATGAASAPAEPKDARDPAAVARGRLGGLKGGRARATALSKMHYNFGRIHQTLRVTPAMEAGVADHVWSLEEIVGLMDRESGAEAA